MVLFDHLTIDQPSLQQHSLSLFNDHGKTISKQALDKRFNGKAVTFIRNLFESYLHHQLKIQQLPSEFRKYFTAIRIMDSTEFKLPENLSEAFPGFEGDGTSACTQLQFEYDILSSQVKHLSIANARNPDFCYASDHLQEVQCKNLIIRDLGYNTLDIFKAIEEKEAFYISRLNTQMIIYEKRGNGFKQLSFKAIVKRLKNSRRKYLDMPIYIGKQLKHPVRLVANLLDQASRERRLRKKVFRKNLGNEKYKQLSQLNLFITNISRQILTSEQIYGLYKIRWQIELVFKAWKSVLKIDLVRKMKPDRFKCYLMSKLLWILISWDIHMISNAHTLKNKNRFLSLYKCFAILKLHALTLKNAISQRRKLLDEWLRQAFSMVCSFGLKEHRHGRLNIINLLNLK